jgi:hypothetical protein
MAGMSLGLSLGLGPSRSAGGDTVTITSTPTTLFESQENTGDAIEGTTTAADGSTATATVNGQTLGTDTVSGGAFSITGFPTAAMVGTGVTVEVTVGTASDTSTTNVRAGTVNWDAKRGVTTATGVSAWVDQIGGISADQSDTTEQPAYPGSASVDFDGTDDSLLLDGDVTADTSHVVVFAVSLDTAGGYLADAATGRLIMGVHSGFWAFYDGAWRDSATAASTGDHVLAFVFDGSGGTADIWLDGSKIDSGLSYTARAIGGFTRFGSNNGGLAAFLEGDILDVYVASGASVPLTDTEVEALMAQIDDYHGLGAIP